mmetsp:Transcript_128438/g.320341  ORF Transcript_128438/g.320341 Transcript_128438/m.320341 type:complete len:84 (-) Transcript_128438:1425-1676(-)
MDAAELLQAPSPAEHNIKLGRRVSESSRTAARRHAVSVAAAIDRDDFSEALLDLPAAELQDVEAALLDSPLHHGGLSGNASTE